MDAIATPEPPDVGAIRSVAPFAESTTVRYFARVEAVPIQLAAASAVVKSSVSPVVRMLLVKVSVPLPAAGSMQVLPLPVIVLAGLLSHQRADCCSAHPKKS
jgi:hypothetical protein